MSGVCLGMGDTWFTKCHENGSSSGMRGECIKTKRGVLEQLGELGREEGDFCWASLVHGLRKVKEPETEKKERKEGRKRRSSQNLHCCKVEGSRTRSHKL